MRMIVAIPLLMAAACGVENDPQNDQVTINYDEAQFENVTEDVGNAAEDAAAEIGNAAERAGESIENEVGDIDVDLNVSRDRPGNSS